MVPRHTHDLQLAQMHTHSAKLVPRHTYDLQLLPRHTHDARLVPWYTHDVKEKGGHSDLKKNITKTASYWIWNHQEIVDSKFIH
jgi:hypothetical protein